MLRVYMKKIEPIGTNEQPEVNIRVTLNTPIVGAEPFLGIFFKNAPEITISELNIPFPEMKQVMEQQDFKKWEDIKMFIDEQYSEYYLQMFEGWTSENSDTSEKHEDILRIYMRKIKPIGSTDEAEVHIKVTLHTPIVDVEPVSGILLKNTPEIIISETTLSFSEMKKVMDQHGFKNWANAKEFILEKYTEYYRRMFQDWDIDFSKQKADRINANNSIYKKKSS